MQQFLVPREVVSMVQQAHSRARQSEKPWLRWSLEKRKAVGKQYLNLKSYNLMKLRFGRSCPPPSTLRGWATAVQRDRELLLPGRPRHLSAGEEENVITAARQLRMKGMQSLSTFLCCALFSLCRGRRGQRCPDAAGPACNATCQASV